MPQYLITLSIGPVQDFIAAARKTRDLWFGSWVLSEISKAAAFSIYKKDNQALIFPSADQLRDKLQPCDAKDGNCFNVGNKLLWLTETTEEEKPSELVKQAKQAALNRWNEIAKQAFNKAVNCNIEINTDYWDKQVDDVLEFFAAWVRFDNSKSYKDNRKNLDKLFNARKNTRNFKPNPITDTGIPKSSLDGLRENVITKMPKNDGILRKAGLKKSELLDCVGIVKRLALDPEQFTPISRLALDPWLRGNKNKDFGKIKEKLEILTKNGLSSRVNGNQKIYDLLPYDGQLLYPDRLKTAINNKDNSDCKEMLEALDSEIKRQDLPTPSPYMAILVADGDRMGKLLNEMQDIEAHKNISKTLAEFATKVPDIVRDHQGHCVYAGGDDVLALLPLDCAVNCSRKLADTFKMTMAKVSGITEDNIPTLSVGLGISHMMTPMGKQLDLARKAESMAKGNELPDDHPKNALAIIIKPRSGAEISFREKWAYDEDQLEHSAESILNNWIEAHLNQSISRQAAYNLRDESFALNWGSSVVPDNLIKEETARILDAKRTPDGKIKHEWVKKIMNRVAKKGMRIAADEMIMTYRIAEACRLAQVNN